MRDQFARTLHEIAQTTPDVFVVVADISPAASMAPFREQFPRQFVNVGVAEQSMIALCAGLALRGCRPFAYTIATFSIYRPFEQVRDDICYHDLPVTIVGIGGGIAYSTLGGTHHAQEDVAVMSALPNMTVLAPCDPQETAEATRAAVACNGPVYLRLGKSGEPDLTSKALDPFVFGRVRRLRAGADACIVSYGPVTKMAFDAAEAVERERGISVALVGVPTLKPLDRDGLAGVLGRFSRVVVVEEHSVRGGLGGQVKEVAWESGATCRLTTIGLQDEFIHAFGSHAYLLGRHGVSVEAIARAVAG